ncbi:IS110 family transposase, partial [Pseudomonas aeruginosa]|nr:IS110 family transposase [Pseudomonas aeruginosa]MCL8043308.1 IS110 family transposase [Pseudomonas aeruginosa]MCL8046022.1 IS110 family transposase [Pseudomonas aeruginosa]MCL8047516.1 IS110 family transposase [Pseudomonas aeruginosa]MCR6940618.1 IS110 family transposase [Pseudomonas aeruginosa]
MNLSRIGLDLAKQVFQVHGVDRHEHVVCRRQLKRAQVRDFFRQLPPCLVAME